MEQCMVNLVDVLLLPGHSQAIGGFLELHEIRRLILLGRSSSTAPCRTSFEMRAASVRLYVCGNKEGIDEDEDGPLASLQCFSPFTGTWEALPSPLVQRRSIILAELDGILYAGSGQCFDEDGKLVKFDPRLGHWQAMPPFLIPRVGYSLVALAGRLFAIGGRHEGFEDDEDFAAPPAAGEYFDLGTGLWYFLDMNEVQQQNPLVSQDGNIMYVCATILSSPQTDLVACLNAQTLHWGAMAQPAFLSGPGSAHMAMLVASCGSVYLGSDESIDRYDTRMHRWQVLPPMPDELSHIDSSEHASHGRLFICGGRCDTLCSSFGCFDPAVQCWHLLPSMMKPCASPAVLSIASGIYVCGGSGRSCMRFCLLRNSWEALDDLVEPALIPAGVVSIGFQDTSKHTEPPPRMFSDEQLLRSVARRRSDN